MQTKEDRIDEVLHGHPEHLREEDITRADIAAARGPSYRSPPRLTILSALRTSEPIELGDGQVLLEIDGHQALQFQCVGRDITIRVPVRDPYDQLDTISYRWDPVRRVWDLDP